MFSKINLSFRLVSICVCFSTMRIVLLLQLSWQRHKLVTNILKHELETEGGIHALSIQVGVYKLVSVHNIYIYMLSSILH